MTKVAWESEMRIFFLVLVRVPSFMASYMPVGKCNMKICPNGKNVNCMVIQIVKMLFFFFYLKGRSDINHFGYNSGT